MAKKRDKKGPPSKIEYDAMPAADKLIHLDIESKKSIFIEALRNTYTVWAACQAAGVASRRTVYSWKASDENFSAAWDDAMEDAVDNLEQNMFAKALAGKDTVATIFMLKGGRPERYKERGAVEHTGKDGGPIEINSARSVLAQALGGNTGEDSKPTKKRN